MSRRSESRLGLYYMVLRGTEGRMFYGNEDYPSFVRVLDGLLGETRYRLHAFCLLPTQAHLAVQMSDIALADFSQRLAIKFGRWMQQKYGRAANAPELAGTPRLVDEPAKARELIRFIHLLPLRTSHDPLEYIWSGHRTYLGKARVACLETRTGLRLFAKDLKAARAEYEKFIQEGLQRAQASRSSRSTANAPRAGPAETIGSLEQLIARIAHLAGRTVADIRSGSRERLVSLLRAVVAWHATRLEIATFGEMTRYLRRDPSSLYSAIKRYMKLYPSLFSEPGKVEDLEAVAGTKINGRTAASDPE
jgi:putative transposase